MWCNHFGLARHILVVVTLTVAYTPTLVRQLASAHLITAEIRTSLVDLNAFLTWTARVIALASITAVSTLAPAFAVLMLCVVSQITCPSVVVQSDSRAILTPSADQYRPSVRFSIPISGPNYRFSTAKRNDQKILFNFHVIHFIFHHLIFGRFESVLR